MRSKRRGKPSVRAAFLVCLCGMLAFAQSLRGQQDPAIGKSTTSTVQGGSPPEKDASGAAQEELEKAVQNPVASLITVPLQNNTNFSVGSFDRTQDVLNIQPVIPANSPGGSKAYSLLSPRS